MRYRSIRFKLFGMFALLALGLFAIYQMSKMNARAVFVREMSIPALSLADDINYVLIKYHGLQTEYIAYADAGERTRVENEMDDLERQMDEYLQQYPPLILDDDERAAFERIRTMWPGFVSRTREELLPASRDNEAAQALAVFSQLDAMYGDLAEAGQELMASNKEHANAAAAAVQATYDTSKNLILGITLAALLLSAGLGFWLTGGIVRNIGRLTAATSAVAAGDLEREVDVQSGDELGSLAVAFNHMLANLRASRAAEAQAREAEMQLQRVEAESRQLLEQTVTDYLAFVEQVARGDLTQRLNVRQNGALGQLGQGLNGMVEGLHRITREVQQANGAIASAAAEILAATAQQAASAAEQSAAITQTTTAVEEVKVIAQQTAQRANEVAQDSQGALQSALQGTQAVEDTVSGMAQIRQRVESIAQTILALAEQTQTISAIITTVSELADQSNLLALNAAIEAARAGEQGKSFAVVAQHVRALAERSKAATGQVRDILEEIQRATNAAVLVTEEGTKGVETGSKLAGQAGQVIHRIAGEVENGAQANVQIAAAAQQQTTGMEQIGQAMVSIQQATTQALAGTRQSERAAQDLHALAQSLQQAIATYRV